MATSQDPECSASNNQYFRLFDLPTELRLQIYETFLISIFNGPHEQGPTGVANLLFSRRKILDEAQSLFQPRALRRRIWLEKQDLNLLMNFKQMYWEKGGLKAWEESDPYGYHSEYAKRLVCWREMAEVKKAVWVVRSLLPKEVIVIDDDSETE